MTMKEGRLLSWLSMLQGIYFFITGVWPILHIESFIWVSGPKYDIWLVKTVGILIIVIGLALFSAGINRRVNEETFLLAVGSAAGLATVDIYYVLINRIWEVYLLDAVVEVVLVLLWVILFSRYFRKRSPS